MSSCLNWAEPNRSFPPLGAWFRSAAPGRFLLRSNLTGQALAKLWQFYVQLTHVEAAFKDFKDDLSLRPIFHQLEHRIEAHIFVAFLAYCLNVSLRARLQVLAPGLTPRSMLEKFAALQVYYHAFDRAFFRLPLEVRSLNSRRQPANLARLLTLIPQAA